MNEETRKKILTLLSEHRTMTIATLRSDGWPQATTVVYANEGLTVYFVCDPGSQKATNLARDDRVSLTIDHETPDVTEITGLSMAAHAQPVVNPAEASKALQTLRMKYPLLPVPMPEDVSIFRLTPTIISVIDYSKGFGHTDLATVWVATDIAQPAWFSLAVSLCPLLAQKSYSAQLRAKRYCAEPPNSLNCRCPD